jgi:hypothetical protein
MMHRKLIFGAFLVAMIAILTGGYFFHRATDAQEPPRNDEPEAKKPDSLFEKLKTDLENKPSSFGPLPSVPAPPVVENKMPAPVSGGSAIAPPPAISSGPVAVAPPVPFADGTPPMPKSPTVPPPIVSTQTSPDSTQPIPQSVKPLPSVAKPETPQWQRPGAPEPMESKLAETTPPSSIPATPNKVQEQLDRQKAILQSMPPPIAPPPGVPAVAAPRKDSDVKPASGSSVAAVVPAVPLPKNSPWSLRIDVVNDETVVVATINKKHVFKIVCKQVDLQTAQNIFKATGKVRFSGESIDGSCDNLSIALFEDRLTLDGAEVRISKSWSSDSEMKRGGFELKGQSLTLRVSDLQSPRLTNAAGKLIEGSAGDAPTVLTSTTSEAKQWSPYGKLRRTDQVYRDMPVWRLEDNEGQTILRFVARGSLSSYEGQTLSVLGVALDEQMMRVTHIAVP